MRPAFEEGGKYHRFYPLFEAADSFLLTTPTVTKVGAHIRDALDVKRYMILVVVALIPCVFMGVWNAGYQHLLATTPNPGFAASILAGLWITMPIILVSYAVGGAWEVLFAVVRKHEINEGFLVTGLLFPLTLPPTTPLWIVAAGISFGVVIGKEVFGGTGMNIFNPALTARAFVFFAFPVYLSGDTVWAAIDYSKAVDGLSGATPLAVTYTALGDNATQILSNFSANHALMDYSWWNLFIGFVPGSIGETSALACLLGAALLIVTGIGSWRIMLSAFLGAAAMAVFLNGFASETRNSMLSIPFYWHWVIGGMAFGIVFMATDPVSGTVTNIGKYIYGALIGMLSIVIRVLNPAFPEGVMLAILFMNLFAPLIDYLVIQANVRRRKVAHAR